MRIKAGAIRLQKGGGRAARVAIAAEADVDVRGAEAHVEVDLQATMHRAARDRRRGAVELLALAVSAQPVAPRPLARALVCLFVSCPLFCLFVALSLCLSAVATSFPGVRIGVTQQGILRRCRVVMRSQNRLHTQTFVFPRQPRGLRFVLCTFCLPRATKRLARFVLCIVAKHRFGDSMLLRLLTRDADSGLKASGFRADVGVTARGNRSHRLGLQQQFCEAFENGTRGMRGEGT